jgi:hypothetical protein
MDLDRTWTFLWPLKTFIVKYEVYHYNLYKKLYFFKKFPDPFISYVSGSAIQNYGFRLWRPINYRSTGSGTLDSSQTVRVSWEGPEGGVGGIKANSNDLAVSVVKGYGTVIILRPTTSRLEKSPLWAQVI